MIEEKTDGFDVELLRKVAAWDAMKLLHFNGG